MRIWSEAWHSWQPTQYRPVEIIPRMVVSEAELRAARGQGANTGDRGLLRRSRLHVPGTEALDEDAG